MQLWDVLVDWLTYAATFGIGVSCFAVVFVVA